MFENFNIKNANHCECGHELHINDITELKKINNPGFFGNIVKYCSYTNCPECGKEIALFLKQIGQTWKIMAVGTKKDNEESIQNEAEKKNILDNEFICDICGKVCKSQIGLNSHIKTHQN